MSEYDYLVKSLHDQYKDRESKARAVAPWWVWALVLAIIVGLTLTGAWYLWGRGTQKVPDNKPSAAVTQADGSVVLEKAPDPKHKPAHAIPKGGKVERDVKVTVNPDAPPVDTDGDGDIECPPVTVNLSLVRLPDKTKRVVASSPDGEIVGESLDIPVEDAIPPPIPKLWAAGAAYSTKGEIGVFVDRDWGWARLGVQANEVKDGGNRSGWSGWAKGGIRF